MSRRGLQQAARPKSGSLRPGAAICATITRGYPSGRCGTSWPFLKRAAGRSLPNGRRILVRQENRQVKWKLLVAKQRLDLATQDSIWF